MKPLDLWTASASAWIAFTQVDPNRTLLLDPPMLEVAGDVRGLRICDVGCGEGRTSRVFASLGADITGIDPCLPLIEEARRRDPKGRYALGSGESLPVRSDYFDLVVCYLVLIDIPDFRSAIREMARIIKRGGRILVANLNSFCTTRSHAWIRDEEGNALHVGVDDYFRERGELVAWRGLEIVNYHRPFESYAQAFISEGLRLTGFREPTLTPEVVVANPKMAEALRVPLFHIMEWRKE